MPFKPGNPKPPGSGRKPGQVSKRQSNRFCELLDGDGFKLKNEIRAAVLSKDVELLKALAQLLRAIDTGSTSSEPAGLVDLSKLSDEELAKMVPATTIHSQT